MAYWLMKSEPESYTWADLVAEGTTEWTGVRNPAAALHLKAMAVGDRAFFYHSGKEKAVVGVMEVVRSARQDGDQPRWVSVAVAPVAAMPTPVTLAAIKAEPRLAGLEMLRQSRLSVSPVDAEAWGVVLALGGLTA
ncbi:EVE domain-containing protein [Sphingomonas sp. H39-1-10]|uniref:EVE domain-containing protein n=1 Tax=Sphingomonas pollutisoli TaxID=3030829 RepID=UPI0023B9146C|nr:EVE domain-containing protein [Sphingomonas pollutisoli]MDF0486863.1 EVE domain-containing protein [Sphingomonas pollutisoli]